MSLDGKTTNGNNPRVHEWTSKEDQEYFSQTMDNAQAILMGSKTYDAAKGIMKHKAGRMRYVFTRRPEDYKNDIIPGQLLFTSDSPEKIIKELEQQGKTNVCLVGGASLNTAFLEKGLIDELWLTIEPIVLGSGNPLFAENTVQKQLELLTIEKLNEKGTILFKYKINR